MEIDGPDSGIRKRFAVGLTRTLYVAPILLSGCDNTSAKEADAVPIGVVGVQRIARLDGDSALLTEVGGIIMQANGDFLVSQPQSQELIVLDPSGAFRRRIGRRGAGPGEFTMLGPMGVFRDTFWVYDPGVGRVSLFDTSGRFATSFIYRGRPPMGAAQPVGDPFGIVSPRAFAPGGLAGLGTPSISYAALARAGITEIPVFSISRAGERQRVVASRTFDLIQYERNGRTWFGEQPLSLSPKLAIAQAGQRFAIVSVLPDSSCIRIVQQSAAGDTLSDVAIRFPRTPLPPRLADSVVIASMDSGASPESRESMRRSLRLPTMFPPVRWAMLADDGSILVNGHWGGPRPVSVAIDPTGRRVGAIDIPPSRLPRLFLGDGIWVSEWSVNGVESLELYQLTWTPASTLRAAECRYQQ